MKTICLPIRVPDNDFCWDRRTPCEYFSNEGGNGRCDLGIGDVDYDVKSGRYPKPKECLELQAAPDGAGSELTPLSGVDMLLAGLLINRLNPMAPHHVAAVRERLGDPTDDQLRDMIITGKRVTFSRHNVGEHPKGHRPGELNEKTEQRN